MNTTKLILNNVLPILDLNNNPFLLYFGLPNSPILAINDVHEEDEIISKSSLEMELDVDDTSDNKTNEIIYKTFFTQLSHKFFVFDNLLFEEIQSELFLKTCEEYFSVITKFNSPIVVPIKADVFGNINKLRRKMNENVMKFQTLYSIVNDEIESQTTNARNSATDALLWLKRAFEFVANFLLEFGMGPKTLADAVTKAYTQSLSRYHGILARTIFTVALRAVPDKTEFLRSITADPNDNLDILYEQQIMNEMVDHGASMSAALEKITIFYIKHGLDSTKIIT